MKKSGWIALNESQKKHAPHMKASELIKILNEFMDKYGDMRVVTADSTWGFMDIDVRNPIKFKHDINDPGDDGVFQISSI